MQKAKWIWINKEITPDQYGEFLDSFEYQSGEIILNISADSIFAVYLNNELVNFSQCSDYPNYKLYDSFDLTSKVKKGINNIKIQVWYLGTDTQCYKVSEPGLIYEIINNKNIVAYSSEKTLSRQMNEYENNYKKTITVQLGYSFKFNLNKISNDYEKSALISKTLDLSLRKQKALYLDNQSDFKIVKADSSIIIDLGEEHAGFVDFNIVSPICQNITIAYGEHLKDGHVPRIISTRDFSFEIYTKIGENRYLNPFRRIGARYIEIFFEQKIEVKKFVIRNVLYPIEKIEKNFNDELVNKIYETSIKTLRLCMHEHYEDCPWREQCLYNLDSRNQMMCGYYVFKNTEYPRSNLVLMSKGLRPDGLLSLCFPAGLDLPIPLFSLAYFQQVYEYVQFTKDFALINEIKDTLLKIKNTFINRIDNNNLIPAFAEPEIWNFTEWQAGLDGNDQDYQTGKRKYDLCLNAYFVYTIEMFNKLIPEESFDTSEIKKSIVKTFYDKKEQMFKISNNSGTFSQLGNSLAILAGLEVPELRNKIMECKNMIPATLSTKAFVYDSLMDNKNEHKQFIIDDILKTYKYMLDNGATSFWETILGAEDFDGAGSLCHGWSAIPIIYFNKLLCF